MITEALQAPRPADDIAPPPDAAVNLLVHEDRDGSDFAVYARDGTLTAAFGREAFDENIAELRADWSLSKFPYLARAGFPGGIVAVGPLARIRRRDGPWSDPEVVALGVPEALGDCERVSLGATDLCRLVEIFWAARRIEERLADVEPASPVADVDLSGSGHGLGVLEAPRGTLVHEYLVNRGRVERLRLTVATQFNNAFINLLLRDLAARSVVDDRLTPEGERLIGRCIRLFDPCISCATH